MATKSSDLTKKKRLIQKRLLRKTIRKHSKNLFAATTDILLFCLYLPFAAGGKPRTSSGTDKIFEEAYQLLQGVNHQTLQRALYQLKNKGLIKNLQNWFIEPIITAEGTKKLKNSLPSYDAKRIWDKRLFLINYDIPVHKNRLRDLIREAIKKIGGISLQKSLYLTFYNPHKVLKSFFDEYHLSGTVLVSELGKDGLIGKGNLKDFLWEQANLEPLNQSYQEFIEKYKKPKADLLKTQVALDYYSILISDPQIPFELLKDKYLGDEAHLIFLRCIS